MPARAILGLKVILKFKTKIPFKRIFTFGRKKSPQSVAEGKKFIMETD